MGEGGEGGEQGARTEDAVAVQLKPGIIQHEIDAPAFHLRDGIPQLWEVIPQYAGGEKKINL
jgi:hypothetical protein